MISARGLRRTYRTFDRRPGVVGALRDLLRLRFDEKVALDHLDLDVGPGERLGLIGPNGAGKSTTIKLLCGILQPTAGALTVGGLEPWRERRRHARHLGVVFGQRTQLWWDLAVIEAFDLLAAIFEVPDADYRARLERFDAVLEIGPLLRVPVRELSLGQRVRCDIAAALLHGPRLLLLDEPTIGLDVAVKRRIRLFIRDINDEWGTTVVLTTHDLADIEAVCDRVVLIDKGRLLFDGSTEALKDALGGRRRLVVELAEPLDPARRPSVTADLPAEVRWPDAHRLELTFSRDEASAAVLVEALLRRCAAAGSPARDLALHEPDIDEVVARFYERGT